MNPKELKKILTTMVEERLPILLKGAPGVGKTDIVKQVAEELKMELLVSRPVVSDPTDFKGLPGIVKGKAEFLPFGDLRQLVETTEPTIAFLDDLGQAPAMVQAAAMQLILARQVNGHKISKKVVFVAATNRREDRAGVTGVLEPVKSRFTSILELTPDADSWIEWAFENDMPAEIIGFIHFRPSLLITNEKTADIVNHPCPRTIAHAGTIIAMADFKKFSDKTQMELLAGAVGEGCAVELLGFIKVYNELPNISAILTDPESAKVPKDPAALWAVVSALVDKVTVDSIDRIMTYGNRLPSEYNIMLIRDAVRKVPKIQQTKAFTKWAIKNQDFML